MDEKELQRIFDETHSHYEGKMKKLFETIQHLKHRCIKLQDENKHLRKQNMKLIRDKKKKQHYKNGKRGTKLNG